MLPVIKRISAKLIWIAAVFFGITVISFVVIHAAPGAPTDQATMMNPMASPDTKARFERLYGLDKPLHVQYVKWVGRMVRLDFGRSFSGDHRPVWDKIKERLPLTFFLNLISMILALSISIPIGIISAYRQGGLFDRLSTIFVFIGFATPGFWLALLLMMLLGVQWNILPISGLTSLDYASYSAWGKLVDLARHLAMPIFIFTFTGLAGMSRFMRTSMLEVLRQDYIMTARAKGLPTRRVLLKHALRNALIPVITILGLSVPTLIGGSVIIEQVFALPGLGQLFWQSVMSRDYPLIMGNLVLGAVLTLAGNLLADVGYALADPRIRYKREGS